MGRWSYIAPGVLMLNRPKGSQDLRFARTRASNRVRSISVEGAVGREVPSEATQSWQVLKDHWH